MKKDILCFETVPEKGRERGRKRFAIRVQEENSIGRSFYEKHGYRPDGKEKIFRRWNKWEIRYIMVD